MYNLAFRACWNLSKCTISKRTFYSLCKTARIIEIFSGKCQILTYNVEKCCYNTNTNTERTINYIDNVQSIALPGQEDLDKILEDPNMRKKFKLLELELDFLRHDAEKVPSEIKPHEWLQILTLDTKSQRRKYLRFLWLNELKSSKVVAKKNARREKNAKELEELKEKWTSGLEYGLQHNAMFLRIYDQTMDKLYNSRVMHAMLFEPKLVYDCSYSQNMNNLETQNCVKQLVQTIVFNRRHVSPFNIYYCNADPESMLLRKFYANCPSIAEPGFPINITSQSYLDIFDRQQLIYLTPQSPNIMTTYDPDMVYIIGALVDKVKQLPFSYAKAKKEGIQTIKLPLDQYFKWASGPHKNLTLGQMLSIMLDLKHTRNWNIALQNVPKRKISKCNTEQDDSECK